MFLLKKSVRVEISLQQLKGQIVETFDKHFRISDQINDKESRATLACLYKNYMNYRSILKATTHKLTLGTLHSQNYPYATFQTNDVGMLWHH